MRYTYLLILGILLFCALMMDCSGGNSQMNEIFLAEKLFYKAQKIRENIVINPDITSPEEFQNAEIAFREIINTFGNQKNLAGIYQQIPHHLDYYYMFLLNSPLLELKCNL